MVLAATAAFSLVLASCGGNEGPGKVDVSKGRNACEKAGIIAFDAKKRYCEKDKSCSNICLDFGLDEDLSDIDLGIDELTCEGKALETANTCLKRQKRCEECSVVVLEVQCTGKRPSIKETAECAVLLGEYL